MSCEHLTMSYSTFPKAKNDALKEPMLFSQPVNVARYDQQKYEVFEKLIEKQLSFFWRPEEIDVSHDRINYPNGRLRGLATVLFGHRQFLLQDSI